MSSVAVLESAAELSPASEAVEAELSPPAALLVELSPPPLQAAMLAASRPARRTVKILLPKFLTVIPPFMNIVRFIHIISPSQFVFYHLSEGDC